MTNPTTSNDITYYEGNAPIILSAPHGGEENPNNIKSRITGVNERDDNTLELTQLILEEFYTQTSLTPHAIIASISREKVDLNREEKEAFEDLEAKIIYDTFHSNIENSISKVDKEFKKGLFIDIHGQSHSHGCIEFGYILDNNILKLPDVELEKYKDKSSIRKLCKESPSSFIELLKGSNSLGSLMNKEKFNSIPSNDFPYAKDDDYFEGAYNTIKYNSYQDSNISSIQVEFPYIHSRDTKDNIQKTAKAFTSSLVQFLNIHMGFKL